MEEEKVAESAPVGEGGEGEGSGFHNRRLHNYPLIKVGNLRSLAPQQGTAYVLQQPHQDHKMPFHPSCSVLGDSPVLHPLQILSQATLVLSVPSTYICTLCVSEFMFQVCYSELVILTQPQCCLCCPLVLRHEWGAENGGNGVVCHCLWETQQ